MNVKRPTYKLRTRDKQQIVLDASFPTPQEAERQAKYIVSLYQDIDWHDIYEIFKIED
jgi:hypothetical protein